jgi:hypothetical protein
LVAGQAAIRSEIPAARSEIADSKTDLLKWVVGLVLVQGGIVVT